MGQAPSVERSKLGLPLLKHRFHSHLTGTIHPTQHLLKFCFEEMERLQEKDRAGYENRTFREGSDGVRLNGTPSPARGL